MGLVTEYLATRSKFFKDHGKKIVLFVDIIWFFLYVYLLLYARDILLTQCDLWKEDLVCYPKANFTENGLPIGIYIDSNYQNLSDG